MPMPVYSYPAPSFETPQGTYYFVPNSSANAMPAGLQQAGGLVRGHSSAASITSTGSWDAGSEGEEKPRVGAKKGRKAGGKDQVKKYVSPVLPFSPSTVGN